MSDSETSPSTSPGTGGTPPGNVYHKEQRSIRSQREKKPRLEAGIHIAPPRKPPLENPFRVTFLASIRRFLVVAAVMVGCLLLTFKGLEIMDEKYGMQFAPKPEDKPVTEEEMLPGRVTVPGTPVIKPSTPDANFDSEAMRRAAFLAGRGKTMEAAGSYADAIARYRESLDVWPYQPQIWAQLGRLYLRNGDYARAQVALERAAADDPNAPQLLNDLGVVYLQEGHVDDAILKFQAYVDRDPSAAQSYFNLSLCYLAKRNLPKARYCITRFLEISPDDARALRQAAYIDASTNNLAEAMVSIHKALEKAPEWPLLYLDAAATTAMMGQTNDALNYLQQAEAKTSAGIVYRLYQEPAFNGIRRSDDGRAFEKDLMARMDIASALATGALQEVHAPAEPISSVSPIP